MAQNAKDGPVVAEESSPKRPSPAVVQDTLADSTIYLTGWQLQLLSLRSGYGIIDTSTAANNEW
jgi:hypothetical protein